MKIKRLLAKIIIRLFGFLPYKALMRLFGILPIQRKAVFISYSGKYSNCSPRAIYEQMRKQLPDFRYIWLMQDASVKIDGAEVRRYGSVKALYHLATAALWVNNSRKPYWMVKKKRQYYVQTWHGCMCLKKIEKDAEDKLSRVYIKSAKHDSECADLFISGARWQSELYRKAFWWDKEILEYGCPRSDVFYQDGTAIRKKILSFYGLPDNINIALYLPTFRNDPCFDGYLSPDDSLAFIESLKKRFGGEWKLIIRLHPNVSGEQDFVRYDDSVLDGNKYSEVNDLIIACSFLLTDYSSCMFDAAEAGKKVLLYAKDIDEYSDERGFYFSFSELPFLLATKTEELLALVETFDCDDYEKERSGFLEKIGCFNHADSSKEVAEYIIDKLRSGNRNGKRYE